MELQALLAKSNALPSIPKVVSEVLSELDADDPSPRKISQLVATDPALTARMLKLANSAFFNVTRQISSVDEAVGILGFSHVRTLVTAVALSSSFKAVPGVNLEQFWRNRSASARQSELAANLDFAGNMPALSANFGHVSRLRLTGNTNITALLPFVRRFEHLNTLELHAFDRQTLMPDPHDVFHCTTDEETMHARPRRTRRTTTQQSCPLTTTRTLRSVVTP